MFSVWSVPRLYNEEEPPLRVILETAVGECTARELTAEGCTSWSHAAEVGVRWSQALEGVSPEAEARPPLEAVNEQHDRTLLCV
jgi:hypothetical protein